MTIWRKRIARRINKPTHKFAVSNTYRFATATMVSQTRLDVTSYVNCLPCLVLVLSFLQGLGNIPIEPFGPGAGHLQFSTPFM